MMRRDAVTILTLSASLFAGLACAQQPATTPTPVVGLAPALPGTQKAAGNLPTALPPTAPGAPIAAGALATDPAVPGLPAAPGLPGTSGLPGLPTGQTPTNTLPGLPGPAPVPFGTVTAAPTPPSLGAINLQTSDSSGGDTTATAASAATPSQLYSFLFIEDSEYGVVRQKFDSKVADDLKEKEIQRLMQKRRQGQSANGGVGILGVTPGFDPSLGGAGGYGATPGYGGAPGYGGGGQGYESASGSQGYLTGGGQGQGDLLGIGGGGTGASVANTESAIRAAAEWDFYYDQLEMYDNFIRQRLLPNSEELPTLEYTASNALQERQDLFESYQEAAIVQSNDDFNSNKDFYERLQKREDRRRAYLDWLLLKRREVEDWSEVWARNVFGQRWADGEDVKVDDWYYGIDFNSAKPVLVAIDDREYIVSKQPVRSLGDGQLNVISNNLTPYDIVDNNGYLKNPVMETLRGTLVVPPAAPVYTTGGTTGTIEIVGGVTSE